MCRHYLLKRRIKTYLLSMMINLGDWRTLTRRCYLELLLSGNRNVFFSNLSCRNCPLAVNPLTLDSV